MKYNILLIEDDPFIKQMYSNKIEEINTNVFTALNKDELKFILDKNNINLILLDLVLPNISGFDILKWLKKEDKFKDIPVIVLSNLSSQADINQAFELGALDYMVKSNYTPTEVLRTIQKYLPQN
jgi:DNA-binding response OmpR family regulator